MKNYTEIEASRNTRYNGYSTFNIRLHGGHRKTAELAVENALFYSKLGYRTKIVTAGTEIIVMWADQERREKGIWIC